MPARVVVVITVLNANRRWAPYLPVAHAPLCDLVLPKLARLGLRRLSPVAEAPTWVSRQGFVDALDHIFLRPPLEAAHSTEVRSNYSFPSDDLPVVTTLHDMPPALQSIRRVEERPFPIPRTPHPQ